MTETSPTVSHTDVPESAAVDHRYDDDFEDFATKPRLRGVIHKYSTFIAAAVGIVLIVGTAMHRNAFPVVAVTIYVVTICALFGTSSVYHRINWRTPRARIAMKRADHSMIFVFIAGTYTPFCVMGLDSPTRWWVLGTVWTGAVAGVAMKVIWPRSPRWLGVILYIVLGWVVVAVAPMLVHNTGIAVIVLLAVGGVFYTLGGVLFALRWPEPWPGVFGHHEVFHACTAIAALLHYIAVWLVVIG
ncbi:hemolysin III family protein [Gordonia sp. (in: high G+C Gram-positive bacteria)]|uniref:PAQR family membrane homeostasis protein TrhA n=1 Tax=Gordonia sp. (in: high G+C Gram-positive bacteria) TaxID=84139 RepID=UPI0016B97718|nr:hemolysin III family protein [Gordonia sp. (in: high G+C Gram-positive bacteria)]NLG47322.1 hemolysin III family protein [Gordonia sp. (in: high G+C Gram-positive bacteria)]